MNNLMHMLCVAVLLIALTPSATSAQTSMPLDVVVTDLNADCVADTVRLCGGVHGDTASLRIHWGKRDTAASCDEAWYAEGDRTYRSVTTLRVANVSDARYSLFAVTNNDDSYRDLVLSTRGTVSKAIGNDTLNRDTTFTIVLFAQRGIDTLTLIDLNNAAGVHAMPVIHRTVGLGRGIEVIDSTRSGRAFIGRMLRTDVETNVPRTESSIRLTTSTVELRAESDEYRMVRVVPNPANGDVVDIHTTGLIAPLRVQFVSMSGEVVSETSLPSWIVHRAQLAVGELPSGMYSLRVIGSDGALAVAQFIILR